MLQQKISEDVIKALKEKETEKASLLRMIISSIKNEAIAQKKQDEGLSDQEVVAVLKKEVKKRKDSVKQYESGDRQDLADKEKKEIEIISEYLPEELSEDIVRQTVKEVISSMGEVAPSQFGQIMGTVMGKLKGQSDGTLVSKIVKEELGK